MEADARRAARSLEAGGRRRCNMAHDTACPVGCGRGADVAVVAAQTWLRSRRRRGCGILAVGAVSSKIRSAMQQPKPCSAAQSSGVSVFVFSLA